VTSAELSALLTELTGASAESLRRKLAVLLPVEALLSIFAGGCLLVAATTWAVGETSAPQVGPGGCLLVAAD
jgi:hypothetical protein